MIISSRYFLSRTRMIQFLDSMKSSGSSVNSLNITPGLPQMEVESLLEEIMDRETIPQELGKIISGSKTGAVLFVQLPRSYLILPPFPIPETKSTSGYAIEPLRSMLEHEYRIALVLVRLGAYAIGICEGERLITSKIGTGLIHGRHKKGGSSQQRFRRHREKQIEYFLTRVCTHVQEYFESQSLDYVVYGGARTTILLLQKRCPFLQRFDNRSLPPLLDIPEPRRAVLDTAAGRIWSSEIIELPDNTEMAMLNDSV